PKVRAGRLLSLPTERLRFPALRLTARRSYGLLALMMAVYSVFHGTIAIRLHQAFVTSAADMSIIGQSAWNSQHGRILEITSGTRSVPNYGEHLEPLWIAASTLYHLWDSVYVLVWLQTFALALGAVPVFWLARDSWGRARASSGGAGRPDYGAGLVFAAIYLLNPFVNRTNSAEVHSVAFAVAPLLLAVAWGWQGKWGRVGPLAVLLLLTREDAGLLVGALGAWAVLSRRAWRPGVALMALGAVGLLVEVGIVWHFAAVRFGEAERAESIYFERYGAFGAGPLGILWGMLTRWDVWAELLGGPTRRTFLREFVASTGGLMLLSPASWLLFAPHFVVNLLSEYDGQHGGLMHYAAPLIPGLMVSAVLGGARTLRWGRGYRAWRVALLGLVLVGTVSTARAAIWQPLARSWILPPVTEHHRLLAEVAAPIPPLAPMSADEQLHPHFAHRPDIYRFPNVGENAEWVIVDVTTNTTVHPNDLKREVMTRLEGDWGVADARDGYILLQRGAEAKRLPDAFFSFGRPNAPPAVPMHVRFGDLIEVVGYDLEQDFWGRVSVRWHLRPLAPLPPTLTLDAPLLGIGPQPLPNTSRQPLTFLLWLPMEAWQVGETYVVKTLFRDADDYFHPAIAIHDGAIDLGPPDRCVSGDTECSGTIVQSPLRLTGEDAWYGWLPGGRWRIFDQHAVRGEQGW
ncbi:MAG TPA: DUF2079 domain-containing protein, partial [Ardenticatenaceae bacterium]